MSSEYVSLSFFKTHKISYFYKKPIIYFPCPHCCEEAQMNSNVATWTCPSCNQLGTLVSLVIMIESDEKEAKILKNMEIVNPISLQQQINQEFKELVVQHGKRMETLHQKVNNLIEYYKQQ